MAWSTPATAVPSQVLTAAMWNASVRDNLLETAPSKASGQNGYFVGTGLNAIAERTVSEGYVSSQETSTDTTFGALTTNGALITGLTTGSKALVFVTAESFTSNSSTSAYTSFEVTGSSSLTAADNTGIIIGGTNNVRATVATFMTVTAGSNTFRMMYRVGAGGGTGTWLRRRLTVMPF